MKGSGFRLEDRIGLAVAIALHVGLVAVLVAGPVRHAFTPPPRMEVSLTDKVGLHDTSPNTTENAAAAVAPKLGEAMPEPSPAPAPPPPKPRPALVPPQPAKPQPAKAAVAKSPGGSRIGNDFLKGVTSANTTGQGRAPRAAVAGPAVVSAIGGVIARQLRPQWHAPQGVDADRLITLVDVRLRPDGSLDGPPRVLRTDGITDSNRPQAARHAEQAIRAIELAEPFQLPPEYYDTWKHLTLTFDRNLSR